MSNKSDYVMNWRNRTKQKLIEYKGGKCQMCGYDKPIWYAYDFHHRDPEQKDFTVSGKSWSLDRLKKELDKCDLLCRNCHAEVHWDLVKDKREERMKISKLVNPMPIIICKVCNKEIKASWQGAECCSLTCARIFGRKVERPTAEVLLNDIELLTWAAIGEKYGVSDNAVRKWFKSYGILDLAKEKRMGSTLLK